MRIGVDVTCWANRRGYGRFTRGLLNALFAVDRGHDFVLFTDTQSYAHSQLPASVPCVVVPTARGATEAASADGRRSLRDMWAMQAAVARSPLDVLFFPSVYTYFPVLTRPTVILGVHDVIAEDYPDLIFPNRHHRRLWALKSWLAHRRANYVLTVSEYAKQGIIRHFRHRSERVWVVDEAPDPIFGPLDPGQIDRQLLARYGLALRDRFLIYLGGVNPHKNLGALIDTLAALRRQSAYADVRLLIVGDFQTDVFTPGYVALQERIQALDLAGAVAFTGFVPDAEVVHLLNAAQLLVLPSFAEGFGLPAVEAAACGTPVVATSNSSLPTLLAGGGLFFDPHQPAQLTAAIERLLGNQPERLRMGRIACERASRLVWERAAEQMIGLLAHVERSQR